MAKWGWLGATAAWAFFLLFIALIRVFLDPRLYAVPGASDYGHMPLADDLGPVHDPIPEAVPVHDPHQPLAPNPYDVPNPYEAPQRHEAQAYQGAGHGAEYAQAGGNYDPNNFVHYGSTGEVYTSEALPGAGATTASADYYAAPDQGASPYQAGYADPYAPQDAYAGNAALDLSHNPYAAGQVQAGALETTAEGYPDYILDPNAPPQS